MPPLPATMAAIVIDGGKGPASALHIAQLPLPVVKDGELLIRVHAAGINRPDLLQRLGAYPPPPGAPETLGLEVAGVAVDAAGRWQPGDRVCALVAGGGYAEYVACDPRQALPIPAGLDFTAAASLPETVFTVFTNVFEQGQLEAGQTLLIHGATSGIGITAIQLAKAAGARVIATGRSRDKAAAALKLGADLAIDTSTENFGERCAEDGGVDVVLDMVGGDYAAQNLTALRHGGRIVYIAALGGAEIKLTVWQIMQKRATITGSTLRGRTPDEKARLAAAVEHTVWPWIESGQFKPMIDRTFPLAEAAAAHAYLEAGAHIGKIVLTIDA